MTVFAVCYVKCCRVASVLFQIRITTTVSVKKDEVVAIAVGEMK